MNKLNLQISAIFIAFLLFSSLSFAYPGGIAGYTIKTNSSGCGSCHSTHNGSSTLVQVVIDGPTTLSPGEQANYSVTITGGTGSKVGVDISASSGTLAKIDNNLKLSSGELVQPTAKSYSGGSYTFNFSYTAPSTTGTQILYSTGMSSKKQWNFAQNFEISVGSSLLSSEINIEEGWNIVSIPLMLSDMSVSNIFPNAASSAFGFDGAYQGTSTLENANGYWIKFSAAESIPVTGSDATSNIALSQGWNLVGPFQAEIPVSGITTNPAGIITSQFFKFSDGYSPVSVLQPGKGYWVNVSQSGEILVEFVTKNSNNAISLPESSSKVVVKDAAGSSVTLYLAANLQGNFYDLPPLPPSGIFDARFSSDTFVSLIESNNQICLKDAVYPVTIKCDENYNFISSITNSTIGSGNLLTIEDPQITRIELVSEVIPGGFYLSQNYPNPFNPETIIAFSIPVTSMVKLDVFNVLGEKVAALLDAEIDAGFNEISFDGGTLTSGVYFYVLESMPIAETSEKFVDVKKMILLK